MSEKLAVKTYDNDTFGKLRVVTMHDGEPWFVAKDVLNVLALDHTALRKLDDDEKGRDSIPTPGGNQSMVTVSEAGLYILVLSSKKPEAKAFKRWVTHEVLPSIRRDGGYMVARADESDEDLLARALMIAQKKIAQREERIARLKEENAEQAAEIEVMAPKALFADAVATANTSILIGELSKILKQNGYQTGQNRLFERLRNDGYLIKGGAARNMPTQRAMEMGLFEIKERTVNNPDGTARITKTTKVTGKGQVYFVNKFCGKRVEPVSVVQ